MKRFLEELKGNDTRRRGRVLYLRPSEIMITCLLVKPQERPTATGTRRSNECFEVAGGGAQTMPGCYLFSGRSDTPPPEAEWPTTERREENNNERAPSQALQASTGSTGCPPSSFRPFGLRGGVKHGRCPCWDFHALRGEISRGHGLPSG